MKTIYRAQRKGIKVFAVSLLERADGFADHEQQGLSYPLWKQLQLDAAAHVACQFWLLDDKHFRLLPCEIPSPLVSMHTCAHTQILRLGMTLPNPETLVFNFSGIRPTPSKSHEWIFPWNILPHYVGQVAGPLTLMNSPDILVETIEEADVVYVYDYCYVMWALGDHHAREHWWLRENYHPTTVPGRAIICLSTYRAMMSLPKWIRNGGQDFVFFWSHPGFEWDDLDMTTAYQDMVCKDFAWSTVFVIEMAQRYRCPAYSPRNSIVVPYSSTEVVQGLTLGSEDEADHLLFFRCFGYSLVKHLRNLGDADVTVCCITREAGKDVICLDSDFMQTEFRVQVHKPYLQQMSKSVYCLILPGNSQSSQRLTEAFLTGCIPVFVGPPFHSLPFRSVVDYQESSIFINITTSTEKGKINKLEWWTKPEVPMQWQADPRSDFWNRYGPRWWFPDIPSTAIVNVSTYKRLVTYLRDLPDEVVLAKQQSVMRQRPLFIYATSPHHPPQATDVIVNMMCKYGSFGIRETPPTKTA
eukprot:jgi/Botrbrau1/17107/Bobra.0157s0010.1